LFFRVWTLFFEN